MSWLQKIALPIKITPALEDFANKSLQVLFDPNNNIKYGEPFYEDTVDNKGVPISVVVTMSEPMPGKGMASALTPTWREQSQMDTEEYSLPSCHIVLYDTIPPKFHKLELKKAMLHELIHCIDAKLNDPNLFDAPWHQMARQQGNLPGYVNSPQHYTAPWEQDAFMSSEAHDQVSMWKRNGVSLERAMQELRNHVANKLVEKEWKKEPKLWRRFMQTMARSVEEIYGV